MRRRARVLVLVVVLMAGCNALPLGPSGEAESGAGGGEPERLTPAPVTSTPVTETVAVDGSRPSWLAPNGTVRVDSLRRGHVGALADQSYTWTFALRRNERGAVMPGNDITRRVETDGDTTLLTQEGAVLSQNPPIYVTRATDYTFRGVGFTGVSAGLYVDGTTATRRTETGDNVRTARVDVSSDSTYAFTPDVLDRYLSGVTVEVRRVTVGSQRLYRLYVPPGDPPTTLNQSAGPTSVVWNYTATAYVTREGFVRTLAVGYDQRSATQNHRVVIRMDYSAVGDTTVERPDWAGATGTPDGDATVTTATVTDDDSPAGTATPTTGRSTANTTTADTARSVPAGAEAATG